MFFALLCNLWWKLGAQCSPPIFEENCIFLSLTRAPFPPAAGLEYPSWTHFSAAHGLDALTWTLLDLPGGEATLTIPNSRGLTPHDLALANGFFSLAQDLQKAEVGEAAEICL